MVTLLFLWLNILGVQIQLIVSLFLFHIVLLWWRFRVVALRFVLDLAFVQYWRVRCGGGCSGGSMVSSFVVYQYQQTT